MEWLNYHHLQYFWVVAREGNLTRASRDMHVAPQTVSAQIRSLENALGERLFDRVGRRLELTETGHLVYRYAGEIFGLGRELLDAVHGRPSGRPLRLLVGVADVLPKLIAHQLIRPALELEESVQVVCREASTEELLGQLAMHRLDVVLSDTPIPPGMSVRAYNHLLGECGVSFLAHESLADSLRSGFPGSLDGAPMLLPTDDTELRRSLDQWLESCEVRPTIAGEFQDSALLKVFGQAGSGVFCAPTVLEDAVALQYGTSVIGRTSEVVERFYAISVERRIRHPAVAAICDTARRDLFGT